MGNIHEITIGEEYGSIFSLHLFLPLWGYCEKLLSQGFTKCIVMIYFFPCPLTTGPSTGIDVISPGRQEIILFSGAPTSVWYWPLLRYDYQIFFTNLNQQNPSKSAVSVFSYDRLPCIVKKRVKDMGTMRPFELEE
jgi:hypothetical protein